MQLTRKQGFLLSDLSTPQPGFVCPLEAAVDNTLFVADSFECPLLFDPSLPPPVSFLSYYGFALPTGPVAPSNCANFQAPFTPTTAGVMMQHLVRVEDVAARHPAPLYVP
jgi:hypothetical protein